MYPSPRTQHQRNASTLALARAAVEQGAVVQDLARNKLDEYCTLQSRPDAAAMTLSHCQTVSGNIWTHARRRSYYKVVRAYRAARTLHNQPPPLGIPSSPPFDSAC